MNGGFELLAVALLYWLPGAGLVAFAWPELHADHRHDRLSRFAVAVATSLSVRPLLLLWCKTAGIAAGPWLAWSPGLVGGALLLATTVRRTRRGTPAPHARAGAGVGWVDLVLVATIGMVVLSRWLAVRGLVVPAWGDSVQHSFVTQLLVENRGLFESWAPYAPMESLTYHFGFHSVAAAWSEITGADAPTAVLWVGQLTGIAAVLTLYPLALELTDGRRAAGAVALIVAGCVSPLPAFYASWGRYTQLAGQALLPVVVLLLDVVCFRPTRSPARRLLLAALLSAGLGLTHYRVALLAATAFAVWPVAALWRWRATPGEWLWRAGAVVAMGAGAVVLVAPWLGVLDDGLLLAVHGRIAAIDPAVFSWSDAWRAWSSIPTGLSFPTLAILGLTAAAGIALRDRAVFLILAWSATALLATNPFSLGLPGMGFVTNFAIGIAAYVPIALLVGAVAAHLVPLAERRAGGRAALAGALLLAGGLGFPARARPVAAEFQLATPADLEAFAWIREHTPADAHFQVDVGLGYEGKTAVGTDGGWWLPLFTRRSSTLPPLLYASERMDEKLRHDVWVLPTWIRRSAKTPEIYAKASHRNYCYQGVTHVYVGDKRGAIGPNDTPLLRPEWLARNPALTLVHETGRAQVWRFDRSSCGNWRQNMRPKT